MAGDGPVRPWMRVDGGKGAKMRLKVSQGLEA